MHTRSLDTAAIGYLASQNMKKITCSIANRKIILSRLALSQTTEVQIEVL